MRGGFLLTSLTWLAFSLPAEARVFSYKSDRVAAVLRGSTGLSRLAQDPYANSSGSTTDFDDEISYNFSGEIGVLIGLTENLRLRLGAEAIRPKDLETKGKDRSNANAELFTLTSSIFVFNPTLTIEYTYSVAGPARFYAYAGAGYAQVSMDNKYVMTAAGNTAFTPITDYTEKSEATVYEGHGGLGFETLLNDNVTFTIDFGYRYLPIKEMKHKDTTATVAETSVLKGGILKNMDGSARQMDLGGMTVAASFRFYIGL